MEINIKPDDLDNYIKNSLMQCTIGKTLQEQINREINEIVTRYDSPVKKIASEYIRQLVQEYLQKEENKIEINNAIAKVVTPEVILSIITKGCYELKRLSENN